MCEGHNNEHMQCLRTSENMTISASTVCETVIIKRVEYIVEDARLPHRGKYAVPFGWMSATPETASPYTPFPPESPPKLCRAHPEALAMLSGSNRPGIGPKNDIDSLTLTHASDTRNMTREQVCCSTVLR